MELRGNNLPEQVLTKSRGRSQFSMLEYSSDASILESAMSHMMDMSHVNILALVGYCPQVKGVITEHVVMPLDLAVQSSSKYKRESVQVLLMVDIVHALGVIHGRGYVHTSLYPENVFIKVMSDEKPVACVGGFEWMVKQGTALARSLPDAHPSAKYAAPELVKHSAKKTSPFMDIYAFGMLSYFVMTGKHGYEDDGSGVVAFIDDPSVRAELRNLVRQCTDAMPTDRPLIVQLQAMMTEIRNNTEKLEDF